MKLDLIVGLGKLRLNKGDPGPLGDQLSLGLSLGVESLIDRLTGHRSLGEQALEASSLAARRLDLKLQNRNLSLSLTQLGGNPSPTEAGVFIVLASQNLVAHHPVAFLNQNLMNDPGRPGGDVHETALDIDLAGRDRSVGCLDILHRRLLRSFGALAGRLSRTRA
jgi:hypothetical protein